MWVSQNPNHSNVCLKLERQLPHLPSHVKGSHSHPKAITYVVTIETLHRFQTRLSSHKWNRIAWPRTPFRLIVLVARTTSTNLGRTQTKYCKVHTSTEQPYNNRKRPIEPSVVTLSNHNLGNFVPDGQTNRRRAALTTIRKLRVYLKNSNPVILRKLPKIQKSITIHKHP